MPEMQNGAGEAAGQAGSSRRGTIREQLIELIGQRNTEALIAWRGGQVLRIPVADKRKMRNARIHRLLRKYSHRKVAKMVGLSARHITTIANLP